MSKLVAWAERIVSPPIKIIHIIGCTVLFLLIFLTVSDVVGRYLAGRVPGFQPVPGTFELTEFSLVAIVFASIGYTQLLKGHISIDALTNLFPQRARAVIDTVNCLLSLAVVALVAWQSVLFAVRLYHGHDVSGTLGIPIYPFALLVAFGSLVFCMAMLVSFLRSLAKAVQHGA
jgi:TRAP-type transport system small permease protein